MPKMPISKSYSDLSETWSRLFKTPPPKNLSRRLLAHATAHQEQVAKFGGLSAITKKKLITLSSSPLASEQAAIATGTRFIREWNGNTFVVDVIDGGFRLGARRFRSLSAVAKAITGAHWNGRAFFGLARRTSAGANKQGVEQ